MILERREIFCPHLRVADDGAVAGDKGDPCGDQSSEGIRLGVQLRRGGRLAMRQRFRREPGLVHQSSFDALVDNAINGPRNQRGRGKQSQS